MTHGGRVVGKKCRFLPMSCCGSKLLLCGLHHCCLTGLLYYGLADLLGALL